MPVGGSRHYGGAGLGEAVWTCPSCGAENAGPISQGCQLCGAGKPGQRADAPPPPPASLADDEQAKLEAAYQAGYKAGYEAGLKAALERQANPVFSLEGKPARTIAAALELFRDQVLAGAPDEIASGEWCSVAEVNALLTSIRAELREVTHV